MSNEPIDPLDQALEFMNGYFIVADYVIQPLDIGSTYVH